MSTPLSRRTVLKLTGAAGLALTGLDVTHANQSIDDLLLIPRWTVTGQNVLSLASFDTTMRSFMQSLNISCGALAVTRNSRLVLAHGYTWSANPNLQVQPQSLFRIASISKSLTSAAIMRLVESGRLRLDQRLTDLLRLTPLPGLTADPRLSDITVLRLLQHLGGWDRSISGDPMFNDALIARLLKVGLPIQIPHIITYGTSQPLVYAPGTTYAYSNYGYCLLGRIIEAVSGQPYQTYIQQQILAPLGIRRTHLGHSLPAFRDPNEVPYVSLVSGPTVYDNSGTIVPLSDGGFNLENLDSAGGWLTSAIELVRFGASFDNPTASPILSAESIAQTFAVPEIGANPDGWYYGCGWGVRPTADGLITWNTGGLPGTHSQLMRRPDGVNWAVIFNQRDDASGLLYDLIGVMLEQTANSITSWPTHDLFGGYFPE
jgi:CubicO group peptidase (beta-lactamase class C family)